MSDVSRKALIDAMHNDFIAYIKLREQERAAELLIWLDRLRSGMFSESEGEAAKLRNAMEEIRDKGAMMGNNWFYHRANEALSSTSETAVQPSGWMPVNIRPSTDLDHIRCLVSDGDNYGMGGWMQWTPEMDRTGFYADDFTPVISDEITHYMIILPPGIKDGES